MKQKAPCRYDGKPIGTPTTLIQIPILQGGPKRFRRLRTRLYFGDKTAAIRIYEHIVKWLSRGMRIDRVAKRVGLPIGKTIEIYEMQRRQITRAK